MGYDAGPFLDYLTQADWLARYRLVYVPNAASLSDAQCAMLRTVPEGRGVRRVSLLHSGGTLPADTRGGWGEAIVPRPKIHEAIRVDLA